MIDSHPAHQKVIDAVLKKHGVSLNDPKNLLTEQERANLFGKRIADIFEYFKEKYRLEMSAEELHEEFNNLLLPTFKDNIVPMPGLISLVKSLKRYGYNLAIASSSIKSKIDIALEQLNIVKYFQVITSGEEVKHGKPAPDIFLKAAEDAGVNPNSCLVLEDASSGVSAAKAAGMRVIGVHNGFVFERLGVRQNLNMADLQVESLEEISPEIIGKLAL